METQLEIKMKGETRGGSMKSRPLSMKEDQEREKQGKAGFQLTVTCESVGR